MCARALYVVWKDSSYDVVLVILPKKLSLCGELCPLMTVGSAFYSPWHHFAHIAFIRTRRAPSFSREIDLKMLISIALINDRAYPPENGAKLSAMTEPNPAKELREIKVGRIIKHVTHTTTCYLHCLVLATNRSAHKKNANNSQLIASTRKILNYLELNFGARHFNGSSGASAKTAILPTALPRHTASPICLAEQQQRPATAAEKLQPKKL